MAGVLACRYVDKNVYMDIQSHSTLAASVDG
jgi:hypothetical protein